MRKAIVSGAAGFIGSHIVDYLAVKGIEILAVDNFSTGNKENLKQALSSFPQKIKVLQQDICSPKILKEMASFCPDVVFHYAGQISVNKSVKNPIYDAQQNVLGTLNLLESCVSCGTKTFLMASSAAIYGEQQTFPANEEHSLHPNSPYGVSKKTCEAYLDYYARERGLNTIAFRYANVYGPRQNAKGESGVIAIYCDHLINKESFTINGDGKQTRDFVYVEDVAKINYILAKNPPQKQFSYFNVGHGKQIAITDLIAMLKKLANKYQFPDTLIKHGPALKGDLLKSALDARKLKEYSQWAPQTSIENGLEKTFMYLVMEDCVK